MRCPASSRAPVTRSSWPSCRSCRSSTWPSVYVQGRRRPAQRPALTLLLAGILILEFGSLQILYLEENAPDANITTASDALWYTIVTISTVGYGDQYPVTNAGRVVGTLIVVVGVGIFGTFTGYLANAFLAPRRRRDEESRATGEDVTVAADTPTTRDVETLDELRELVARPDVSLEEVDRLLGRRQTEEA